jgi:S-adenosylmethionine:tRNA ribosyltransferase-isomerase
VDTSAFDYDLPAERIAQQPVEPRDAARLLVDEGAGRRPRHRTVADLPSELAEGDLLVLNTTRVLAARLHLHKSTGGAAEVLLLEPDVAHSAANAAEADDPTTARHWTALVRPGRRLPAGTVLFAGAEPVVEVGAPADDAGDGVRRVHLRRLPLELMAAAGEVPLPPYIHAPLADADRYQTVYADRPASVAAPTAGLHLTDEVLADCRRVGVAVATVELVVGLGTFRPIATDKVEDHTMHAERYRVPPATLDACEAAERVVAVGTTTVRALESAAATGRLAGRTELFICRPYPFALVDRLLTNFHMPSSSLLVLIDAFVGPRWRDLYDEALAGDYRFLSFGDAMLLTRSAAA